MIGHYASIGRLAGQGKAFVALLRGWWRPLLTSAMLCALVILTGPSDTIDRRFSDLMLVRQQTTADPRLLIVEINADDMRLYGGPPFNREGMALILNRLAEGKAARVLVDSFFGAHFDPGADKALAAAMARLGPGRLAIDSGITPDDLPIVEFADNATIADARLTPDVDGWHRRIGLAEEAWGINPARWLATGESDRQPVLLDLRMDPRSIERRSAREMIASRDDLSGRIVIVGVSAQVAPTRAMLPLNRAASRQTVIASGVDSVASGYQDRAAIGALANDALRLLAVALGFLCAIGARSGRMTAIMMLATGVVLFAASLAIGREFAVEIYPVQVLTLFLIMANVTLIQRLKLITMVGSFLRGDMSPEEIWAWRGWEGAQHPAMLLGANGRIKRHNRAAAALVSCHSDGLAGAFMPKLGERAEFAMIGHAEDEKRHYELDWPFPTVPLVVLRDVTEAEQVQRQLEAQLLTDELTGKANRRGFERALNAAVAAPGEFAVLFIDMNGFKAVNDTHGHDAGDELLALVAERIAAQLRADDVVARLGGDEFALIVRHAASEEQIAALVERIAKAVSKPIALGGADCEVTVGAAIGSALSALSGRDPGHLLHQADKAMYRDKLRRKLALAA